jgi:hypothetical protein
MSSTILNGDLNNMDFTDLLGMRVLLEWNR